MKILVTGMSGLIGGAVRERLEGRADLSALNRSDVAGVATTRADLADFESIRPAFDGVDTVVHLAAKAGENFPFEDLLATNVAGTRHVYEAARQAGCRRVVFASSGATVSGWENEEPYRSLAGGDYDALPERWTMIDHTMPARPAGVYGSTKVWGETLGRYYAETAELSVLCVRLGYVNAADRPGRPRDYAIWCSQRDIVNMIERCIDAPAALRYDVLFANSANRYGYRDLSHSKAAVGFEPEDAAEDHRSDAA